MISRKGKSNDAIERYLWWGRKRSVEPHEQVACRDEGNGHRERADRSREFSNYRNDSKESSHH